MMVRANTTCDLLPTPRRARPRRYKGLQALTKVEKKRSLFTKGFVVMSLVIKINADIVVVVVVTVVVAVVTVVVPVLFIRGGHVKRNSANTHTWILAPPRRCGFLAWIACVKVPRPSLAALARKSSLRSCVAVLPRASTSKHFFLLA